MSSAIARSNVRAPRGECGLLALSTALLFACSSELGGSQAPGAQLDPTQSPQVVNTTPDTQGGVGEPSTAVPNEMTPSTATAGNGSTGPVGTSPAPQPLGTGSVSPARAYLPPPGALRRLTATQFRNAIADIFDVEVDPAELDADNWSADFAVIGATTVVTSERGVEQYHAAIETTADAVFSDPQRQTAFTGCGPGFSIDDRCVQRFIERAGRLAWRRPLDASELERLSSLARTVASDFETPAEGLRWVTVALFTSPNFLYRSELGTPNGTERWALTGFEMASRLAFLLWNSTPDETLLDEAATGELDNPDGLQRAAERMLASPRGRASVGAFAEEYMRLHRIDNQAKDAALFPEYDAALRAAMIRDMKNTWEHVVFDDAGDALQLFTTRRAVVNAELARLYGLDDSGLDSLSVQEVTLPEDSPRVGILGKAGFLSQFANQKEGSPTLRGKFIRQTLMCTPIPSPPGDVDVVLDDPPADMPMTKRERLEQHRSNETCAGCHALMDPLGLPFETFDAIGRYRTTELGLAIDPSGEVDGQTVADSREFGAALASSEAVARCLVRKYYSYATGRAVRSDDQTVVESLSAAFAASGHDLRQLIMNIVTHQAFAQVAPQPDLEVSP